MGIETAFFVDFGPPNYAFNPCGHMASEQTINYWANVAIPNAVGGFIAVCPFCAVPPDGCPGYIKFSYPCMSDDIC